MDKNKIKIAGIWSGHDCASCILENGNPTLHVELERYIREKEPAGDSIKLLFDTYKEMEDVKYLATCYPSNKLLQYEDSYNRLKKIVDKNGGEMYMMSHHQAHAANTFFSSNYDEALIITMDGGGIEDENPMKATACTIWKGSGNKIEHIKTFTPQEINIGSIWTRCTRYIFGLQSGWPYGHQAGTVMALATIPGADGNRFYDDFRKMLTVDIDEAGHKPSNQPAGPNTGKDPIHPYLGKWTKMAQEDEQTKYDIAASLQKATEQSFKDIIKYALSEYESENLCLAGGVTLNSVAVGKVWDWFPTIKNIYVTPTPHDGGLPIGAAQYVWHHILDNPRVEWKDNCSASLGELYSKENIDDTIEKYKDKIVTEKADDTKLLDLLENQKIVSVFGGGSESGRRALGNRSILADPRSSDMKDMINEKVKHRQWFRPFAPSIIREAVKDWFIKDVDSPYMSVVLPFKENMKDKVKAVNHLDGTGRLQSVTENDNKWYYNIIKKFGERTGVPILLNTSFNDREPIVETPEHAISCFLGTDIDYVYFYDVGILVSKKETN